MHTASSSTWARSKGWVSAWSHPAQWERGALKQVSEFRQGHVTETIQKFFILTFLFFNLFLKVLESINSPGLPGTKTQQQQLTTTTQRRKTTRTLTTKRALKTSFKQPAATTAKQKHTPPPRPPVWLAQGSFTTLVPYPCS